ncbi:MAG: hypothetical protein JSR24_00745 [Proteobacteria bacterium]|nr:hypothetical protein [Pseudomonadota bacterium]
MIVRARRDVQFGNALATRWLDKVPGWTIVAFCIVYLAAFLPCVVFVVGIHNDYEMIWYKTWGLFHTEAAALVAIGRPIAALLTNLTVLPAMEIADFRWIRMFSIATVWVMGIQLMIICICHLAIRPAMAMALALAIFLVPSFLYSVLGSAAWAPHLTSIFLALWAYGMLSRSNVQATTFIGLVQRREYRSFLQSVMAYAGLRPVILAIVILQLSLYDYPPQAMILACLPIATLLFSRHAPIYRVLLALRDIAFLGVNLVVYAISAKLVYIPIVRMIVYRFSKAWYEGQRTSFDLRIAENYRYSFNADPLEALKRLHEVAKVSADLWFLPQLNVHTYVVIVLISVALSVVVWNLWRDSSARLAAFEEGNRLRFYSWHDSGAVALLTIGVCFLFAGSAVLGSGGGFVTYRTIAMPIAVVAVVALFAVRYLGEFLATVAGVSSPWKGRAGDCAAAALVIAATGAILYDNYLTMRLARNEHAYIAGMIREATAKGASAIVLIDPRPFTLPEDHPVIFDQKGRAMVPYEIGCFSGYCVQTDAIFRVIAAEQGLDPTRMVIVPVRNDEPGPGITCELFQKPFGSFPDKMPEATRQLVDFVRRSGPVACFNYDLKWHDVSLDLSAKPAAGE